MKQISTYSANQPGIKDTPVEGLMLIINQQLPKPQSLDEWNAFLETEATEIVDALVKALPQGLTDRIAVKLMGRMVTSFAIPMETK
jgi:hypothetical protein